MSWFSSVFNPADDGKRKSTVTRPPGPTPTPAPNPHASRTPQSDGSTGGFFNLPVKQQAVHASEVGRPSRGDSISGSAAISGFPASGGSPAPLFSGMVVAPQAPAQAPAASGFDFLSGMGVSSTTTAPTAVASTISPPMPSSFSFMLGGGNATEQDHVPAPAPTETGFSFLSSAAAPSVAPPAPVPTSTLNAFLSAGHVETVPQQVGLLPVVSVDAVSANVVPTANIKKKKPGFRPGFAREEGGPTDAPATGATSGSLLSGLVVHEDADDTSAHTAPSGMLAGLKLHSENVPEEGPSPTADDTTRNASSFAFVAGTQHDPSMLSGLQLHNGSELHGNGTMFGGLIQSMPALPPSSSALPMPSSSAIDSNFSDAIIAKARPLPAAPAPAPVPTKVPSDPTERMQEILRHLNDAASATRAKLADVKIRLRSLLDADRKSNADIEILRERLARVEAQQDEAIKGEQFEAAEALNGTLEGLRSALSAAETGKRQVALDRATVEAEQHEVFSESLSVVTESVMGLKKYVDDRELVLAKFRREALSKHTATSDRLANEEEQLRLKEEHVELDQKLVEEEKHQVEKAITDQTTELDTQVEQLRTKHTTLAAEVLELERLLEVKRREERTAASQLEDAESRIKQIRSKFDKQSKRLQSKQAAVEAERNECNNEAAALQAAKRDFSSTLVRDYGTETGYIRQLDHADSLSSTLDQLRAALLHLNDRRSTWTANAAVASRRTAEIQVEIDSSLRKLRAIQTSRAALEAQATTVRATIAGVDAKLPLVNEEKKNAVAERKFKEAGRLTEEVKRLSTQREEAEKELSSCLSGIDDSDRSFSDEQSNVEQARKRLSVHEHATDVARVEALREAIRTLRRHIRRVAKPKSLPDRLVEGTGSQNRPGPQLRLPDGVTPSTDIIPRDVDLGVKLEAGGRSHAQLSAKAFLESERDVLLDELNQLCMKHGMDLDLGDDTASDSETRVTKPDVALSMPSVAASAPTAPESPCSEGAQENGQENVTTSGEGDASPLLQTEGVLTGATHVQTENSLTVSEVNAAQDPDDTQKDGAVEVATEEAAPQPNIATLRSAYLSAQAAIREKEEQISVAVQSEDYDTADSLQADIDAMLDHCQQILGTVLASGISEEEFAGGVDADVTEASAAASLQQLSPLVANLTPSHAEAANYREESHVPTETNTAPSSFQFLSAVGTSDQTVGNATERDSTEEASTVEALPATSFSFLSGLQVHEPSAADVSTAPDLAAFLGGLSSGSLPAEATAVPSDFSIEAEQED